MSDIVAQRCHALNQLFDGVQKVEGNEPHAMILPQTLLGNSPGCDDDLGPIPSRISYILSATRPSDEPFRVWLADEVLDNGIAGNTISTRNKGDFTTCGSHDCLCVWDVRY